MRPKKADLAVFGVVLLAFAVMGGFYWGRSTVVGPVRIVTRSAAQGVQQEEVSSRELPSAGSETQEDQPQGDFPVNINTASVQELQTLPGIGEVRAEAIVAYREEHGPFAYVEDLCEVSGIGEGILANLMDYITVGEQNNG